MSVRRFATLVRGLPASARVWDPENGGWTLTDHLLATTAEMANATFRAVLASIPSKQSRRLPDPLKIPRPGNKPKVMSMGQLARAMAKSRR